VPDLDRGIEDFASRLGVAPLPGGRHESLGTHNAILPLEGGAYLELLAPDPSNPDPALGLPFGLGADAGPRLLTWAARTGDLAESVESSRRSGFDPGAVVELSRETSDGRRLRWRLSVAREPFGEGLVPFLIDWGESPHPSRSAEARCRLEDLRAEHPQPGSILGALAALGCSLAVTRGPRACLFATLAGPRGRVELRSGRA
jgi:hypothetical protein